MDTKGLNVRFWYERKFDAAGNHVGFSGKTVAIIWENGTRRYIGVSHCAGADQFDRKKGRAIAFSRAQFAKNDALAENRERHGKLYDFFDFDKKDSIMLENIPEFLYTPKEFCNNGIPF